MDLFKQGLPLLVPIARPSSLPTLLFSATETEDRLSQSAKADFTKWVGRASKADGSQDAPFCKVVDPPAADWEETLQRLIHEGNYGRIFIGATKRRAWRERMLYRQSGKVVGLLGASPNRHRVLAPVDLSEASLLAMVFLKESYMQSEGIQVCFTHILTHPPAQAEQDWKRLKSIAGIRQKVPLRLVKPKTDVASALVEMIHSGNYGTIVMGKRGLSGLKRWLLGSVSAGVLRRLEDQTLILVD
jgi:2,4-dienoyl-CoA reductase (NADPH2)